MTSKRKRRSPEQIVRAIREADEFMRKRGNLRDQVETNLLAVIEGSPGSQSVFREKVARLQGELGWEIASGM